MALGLGCTAALRPPLPQAQPPRMRFPQDGPTKLMRPMELMALERLHLTTLLQRWLHRNSGGTVLLPLAPSGAE